MPKSKDLKRKYRFCISLNKKELDLLKKFSKKYSISNKSQLIREALMRYIIDKMVEQDYPTLFETPDTSEKSTKEQDNTTKTQNTITTTHKQDEPPHPKLF